MVRKKIGENKKRTKVISRCTTPLTICPCSSNLVLYTDKFVFTLKTGSTSYSLAGVSLGTWRRRKKQKRKKEEEAAAGGGEENREEVSDRSNADEEADSEDDTVVSVEEDEHARWR